MEFKKYTELLSKNILFIVVITVAGLLLALLSAKTMKSNYSQSQTFFVASQSQSASPQPNADFYKEEEARSFTDTAVAIIQSPDFQNDIQKDGGSISVKKNGPQILTITTTGQTKEAASSLLKSTASVFNAKLTSLNNQQTILKEVGIPPQPQLPRLNKKVTAVAGLVFGFAVAVMALSFKTYFKL